MNPTFQGEHLLPGQIGHFLVLLSFISSLVATIAYIFSAQAKLLTNQEDWRKLGRVSFFVHFASILGVFVSLFYIIFTHRFEYHYAWSHSSTVLPFKYLLSCFWEGQEGSFLLWLIWHGLLGCIVAVNAKKWEAPVMATVSGVQLILGATIIGLYFFGEKIGSSPFALLRHQMQGAPIFQQPNYLEFIKDGNGLNPLLQNYWMVIHPPILFMGFAATLIPFAYTIAGLWKKDFTDWVKPTLSWGLFGVAVLGLGICMGGAWAYESLSFGGYWAWDPVENASLVPWLTLVAGVHTLNINKHSKFSLKTTLLFFILTFFLIIYSTYLTRTGILGDTSVHAFTGEGASLSIHLIGFLIIIAIISFWLFFKNSKAIASPQKEEATWTREFWMYIGSLVLLISAIQITFTTSIPVWNKMFGLKLAPPADPMYHYNRIQIWIAVVLAVLIGITQFFKYKNTEIKKVVKDQIATLIITTIISLIIGFHQHINQIQAIFIMVTAVYAVVANIGYLIKIKVKEVTKWGASIAHFGFGLMLLGILLSSFNKHVISKNKLNIDLGLQGKTDQETHQENQQNILLFRNTPAEMSDYTLTYLGDSVVAPNHFYKIQYTKFDKQTNKQLEKFILYPLAQINPKMGLISSPDNKKYWDRDVFTYVTKTLDKSSVPDTMQYTKQTVKPNDTLYFKNGYLIYRGINKNVSNPNYIPEQGDIALSTQLDAYNLDGKTNTVEPVYFIRGNMQNRLEDTLHNYNLYVRIAKINMDKENTVDIEFKQPAAENDYVVMKAIVFPHINILGIGTVIMTLGSILALFRRLKQTK
ncbi:MAG: cytochrome c biogenesis protein CcsA [Chitinophagaceae bacterium]|nr:cytochrome c biogenesis protein CcsA [Chitinophagaceae bacterium]